MTDLTPLRLPPTITESYLPSIDLTYHILTAGKRSKPLLLLLHGFPELAFSWRKIMPALAEEGYYVVAYDQRGYGRTTGWDTRDFASVDLNTFTFTRLVRDAVVLVSALGYKEVACVVGHDFGSVAASMCAVMRPDVFKSVVMMSHPFAGSPSLPFDTISNSSKAEAKENVHRALAELDEPRKHYKMYYSTQPAASEMDNPPVGMHEFLRGYFHLKSADWEGNDPHPLAGFTASEFAKLPLYYVMPLHSTMPETVDMSLKSTNSDPATVTKLGSRWLSDSDLAVYVEEYTRNGFQGGLNWYRVTTNPELMKDTQLFAGRKIDIPSLFVAGKKDWGTYQEPGVVQKMGEVCSQFRGTELVEGAGHWVQQEQPEEVVKILKRFLHGEKVKAISY